MNKTKVSQEQFDRLTGLWNKACEYDNLDPELEGALYVFSKENPWSAAYQEYKEKLQSGDDSVCNNCGGNVKKRR